MELNEVTIRTDIYFTLLIFRIGWLAVLVNFIQLRYFVKCLIISTRLC